MANEKVILVDAVVALLFRDIRWTPIEIPDEGLQIVCPIEVAWSVIRQSLIIGGAIGVKFPAKLQSIFEQVHGDDAKAQTKREEDNIKEWISARAEGKNSTLKDLGNLKIVFKHLEETGKKWMHRDMVYQYSFGYFLHGCVFGKSHKDLFLNLLGTSIRKENFQIETIKNTEIPLPPELQLERSIDDELDSAQDLLIYYEQEVGVLSSAL